MTQMIGGWRMDLEDRAELAATASPMPDFSGAFKASPPVSEPWTLMRQENQASQGACQGHALSDIDELCYAIANGKSSLDMQLSRQFAYVETQRIDGLIGADRGSTISGGVKLAKTRGICEESMWPYTGRYHTSPPNVTIEQCYANAAKYRNAQHFNIAAYDESYNFVDRGTGGISWGIRWNSSCESAVCEHYRRGGGGGHAIPMLFKSPRLDSKGRNYMWIHNSWGANFGNRGWSEWSPAFIEEVLADSYTVAIGLTDMVDVVPRPLSHLGKLV